MPHVSHIFRPAAADLVVLRFSVRSDKITPGKEEVFINTCADGVIRVPKTLMREGEEPGYMVFEALVPADVAAAVRSICAELFRLTRTSEEEWTMDDSASEE
jgi:hypothetical protein